MESMNSAMANVQTTGVQQRAAVADGNAARAAARASLADEKQRIRNEQQQLAVALVDLFADKQELEDAVREQCIEDLAPPLP